MLFDYYGEDVNQSEIADVARTFPDVTFTDELRRAAHFSNISTSMGNEMSGNVTGYTPRELGYAAFEAHGMDLAQLKTYVDQDKPLILLMWYSEAHVYGHYRVVTGYNETDVFLHDPWAWGGKYGGPNIALNYSTFANLWSYYNNWTLYVSPWTVNVSAPIYMRSETPFQVNVTITYPQSLPNSLYDYPASSCNATIILPANLTLVQGELQEKEIGTGLLEAGVNSTVSWMLVANLSGTYVFTVEAEGLVSGFVGEHNGYPPYVYGDRIGTKTNLTIQLNEDIDSPAIGIPSRKPEGDVPPNQDVEVLANVTDSESGVKNATLLYNFNNSQTWNTELMSYNSTSGLYNATIPGQAEGTYVRFKIVAYDYVGNNATRDGTELYCTYQVVSEFPPSTLLFWAVALSMLTAFYVKKSSRRR
jgi:hypothetical protein